VARTNLQEACGNPPHKIMKSSVNKSGRGSRQRAQRRTRNQGNSVGNYVGDAWSLAKRTAIGLNEIRKLINVEVKYIDTSFYGVSLDQAGVVYYLTALAQGDDITDREGDSIKVQTLEILGDVYRNSSSTAVRDTVRIMIVRDLTNEGVTPTGADVLSQASSGLVTLCAPNFLNSSLENKRFSYLYDEIIELDTTHTAQTFRFTTTSDKHVYFRGNANSAANAGTGSYWLLMFSNNATNTPLASAVARVTFTDN